MKHTLRAITFAFAAALLLSGCGLFGSDTPRQAAAVESDEVGTVRVNSGSQFFDIDPAILLDFEGEIRVDALDMLADRVADLSLGTAEATDAGILFNGGRFVVNPSIPGSTPDLEALLTAVLDPDFTSIDITLLPIPAAVSDEDAEQFAAQLNDNLSAGLEIEVDGITDRLRSSALGEATTVEHIDDEWVVSVDYDGIESELRNLFPDVSTEGGQATFAVIPSEDGTEPATVEIVLGEPAVVCCGDDGITDLARALTGEIDVAELELIEVDGERGVAWAEELGINEVVGSFSTRYTAGQSRTTNIRRIAELTQGMIIEPGQTWSLNEAVGQRTIEKGFVPAGTIINGHLSDSVGGGISQFATTIFNAAFFAGLEYDEYQSHSIYFSRYPYGREATISWPAPQLEIHNPTPYGILIWPTTTANSITVDLYSTEWVEAEQTGQYESPVQEACTRVTTERTRTFLDGTVDVDSVFAIYREEGIGCNGEETVDPDAPPTTTTTTTIAPPPAPNPPEPDPEPTAPTPTNPDEGEPEPADPPDNPDEPENPEEPVEPEEPETPPEEPEMPPEEPGEEQNPGEEPENPEPEPQPGDGEEPGVDPEEAA